MIPNLGTAQERRTLCLKAAAEAETAAARLTDLQAKAASIDLAVTWMMAASEISEYGEGRKRLCSGAPYWMAAK
jgi:hypothetical protein